MRRVVETQPFDALGVPEKLLRLVSGDTDPQRLIEVAQRGLPLLHKPVDPAHLRSTIARLLADADASS